MNPILSIQNRFIRPYKQKCFEKTCYGKQLSKYKNRHKGQRCFIVANGPSLTSKDLDLLHERGEVAFGMNRIYKMFEQTNWRPIYYVCEDELIAKS